MPSYDAADAAAAHWGALMLSVGLGPARGAVVRPLSFSRLVGDVFLKGAATAWLEVDLSDGNMVYVVLC